MYSKFLIGAAVAAVAAAVAVYSWNAEANTSDAESTSAAAQASQPTVTVSTTISGNLPVSTPTGSNGVTCTGNCCQYSSGGTVRLVWDTNGSQYLYVQSTGTNTLSSTLPGSVQATSAGSTVDFAAVGADGTDLVWEDDPTITVQTGSCPVQD